MKEHVPEARRGWIFREDLPPRASFVQDGGMDDQTQGVPEDDGERLMRRLRAAEEGDPGAQATLGLMYAQGQGAPEDPEEAARWLAKAAEQGEIDGQLYLGAMYAQGRGVSRNFVEAYKWSRLAAAQGDAHARENLEVLKEEMSEEQIAEAEGLIRIFEAGE